jgi:hypothetical protein
MTNTIEAGTLRDWLEAQQPVTVVDVRTDEDRAFPTGTPAELEAGANRCAVR